MSKLLAIAKNSLFQTVRQPIYGIIVLATLGGMALTPAITGWTLDDDNKMLRDLGLSTLLIQGLFLACFAAASVLDLEIEEKTVLTVAAKPVNRAVFLLGKYLGVFGGILVAYYLSAIAFFMSMRHGVLQMASETSDLTVIFLGPVLAVVLMIAAAVLNYLYDWRFLPTLIALLLIGGTVSTVFLFLVDRDLTLQQYEITQTMENLPPEVVDQDILKGIVDFRPYEGEQVVRGAQGHLVRSIWQGPISDEEMNYLLGLSDMLQWKKDVKFLVDATRDNHPLEIVKAALLVLPALALLTAVAITAATRFSMVPTFVICLVVLILGLSADYLFRPMLEQEIAWAEWLYAFIPNFQCFWMVDALADRKAIPWSYVGTVTSYAALYVVAFLFLGMAMFETREVG